MSGSNGERRRTLKRVLRERFGDPKDAELERPVDSPEIQAKRRRDLNAALRRAYDENDWRGIDRT